MIRVKITPDVLEPGRYSDIGVTFLNQARDAILSSIIFDIEASPPIRLSGRRSIRIHRLTPGSKVEHRLKVYLPEPGNYTLYSDNFSYRDDTGETHRERIEMVLTGQRVQEHSEQRDSRKKPSVKPENKSLNLFISYAHNDEPYVEKLKKHLSPLRRRGLITEWYDGYISSGGRWSDEINQALHRSDLVILLVSIDFLTSDFCMEKELPLALQLEQTGQLQIIPVILRDCRWKDESFAMFNPLPRRGALPIALFEDEDTGFREVADGIAAAVNSLRANRLSKDTP